VPVAAGDVHAPDCVGCRWLVEPFKDNVCPVRGERRLRLTAQEAGRCQVPLAGAVGGHQDDRAVRRAARVVQLEHERAAVRRPVGVHSVAHDMSDLVQRLPVRANGKELVAAAAVGAEDDDPVAAGARGRRGGGGCRAHDENPAEENRQHRRAGETALHDASFRRVWTQAMDARDQAHQGRHVRIRNAVVAAPALVDWGSRPRVGNP